MKTIQLLPILILCAASNLFAQKTSSNLLLADPTIFKHENTYYAYGTNGRNSNEGIPVYGSKDLKNWHVPSRADSGYALKKGSAFGTKGFWAPQVFEHEGVFYMAYTANESIAIAQSNHPAGPFTQKEIKALPAKTRQIDPFVLFDNGKAYLYHVRVDSGNRIFVAELKPDFSDIKQETLTECLRAETGWENTNNAPWPVAEGPTVVKRNGMYHLFFSCNDFRNIDYAVGMASAPTPFGPWKRYEMNPIISRKNTGYNGSGHGDLLSEKNGKTYYVFHTHQNSDKVPPRKTALIEVKWKGTGMEAVPGSFRWLDVSGNHSPL